MVKVGATSRTPSRSTDSNSDSQNQERQRVANSFANALNSIRGGSSGSVSITGIGTGSGESYANYAAYVRTLYQNAWVVPDDATTDDAVTEISITIARDGTIVSSRISKRSGDPALDASVKRVLERVTTIGKSFPDGARENQRSYIIPFSIKARRGTA
jgi:TonB family protein